MINTINNAIPYVPENTLDPAAGLNLALNTVDALLQCSVLAIQNTPPATPANGDRYLVGVGTGDWVGQNDKIARWVTPGDYWEFYNANFCINQTDESLYGFFGGTWKVLAVAV